MTEQLPAASVRVPCIARRNDAASDASRIIPEETPIAFTYGGSTHAVMMATPADLEDFAVGFALTEGLVDSIEEAGAFEIVSSEAGIELRSWLAGGRQEAYAARKRSMAGPTGCGLCGIESLEAASRPLPVLDNALRVSSAALIAAMERLPGAQTLNRETRAVHAAAFWAPESDALIVREDVGRHNALDKLAGALARQKVPASSGRADDEPHFRRTRAKGGAYRRAHHRGRLRAHRSGRANRGTMRHDARRGRARPRLRNLHPPRTHIGTGLDPCRIIRPRSSSKWPIRSASSSPRRGRSTPSPALRSI
jgi:FdhD protein